MAGTITVLAQSTFVHEGRSIQVGTFVALAPKDAILLAQRKLVTLTRKKAPAPDPEPAPAPKKARTYKRRDLQAEAPSVVGEHDRQGPDLIAPAVSPDPDADPGA